MGRSKATWAFGAGALLVFGTTSGFGASRDLVRVSAPAAATATGSIPLGTAPNYRVIVAQNTPAVAGITTEQEIAIQLAPFSGNLHEHALGSGFIFDPDGLILTNAHLVRDATQVTVKLADRREFKAKVLGFDSMTDIAVLKIDAQHLPFVRLGNSDQLEVGDYVLAIGQPYGFAESATAGIVSAKGRSLPGDSPVPFIQTDVAVNPGNSGGPLFDASGAVIGINSQIYSTTGAYEGLSFAVPINLALQIKDQIVAHGKVEHARLGVQAQSLTAALASSFRLTGQSGALIASVDPDSAASLAGLRAGDVILKYDGQPIRDPGDLSAQLAVAEPGQHITLDIWRDGKPLVVKATLGTATMASTAAHKGPSPSVAHDRLGLALRPLTPAERNEAGVACGLLVEDVSGGAAEAGIQPGDIVLGVNGTLVKTPEQMRDVLRSQKTEVALLIQRDDVRLFVAVPLS